MRDLENVTLLEGIKSFAQKMNAMRRYLALVDKLHYKYHKEGWFLEATEIYCEAINGLVHDLNLANLKSRGFLALPRIYNELCQFRRVLLRLWWKRKS